MSLSFAAAGDAAGKPTSASTAAAVPAAHFADPSPSSLTTDPLITVTLTTLSGTLATAQTTPPPSLATSLPDKQATMAAAFLSSANNKNTNADGGGDATGTPPVQPSCTPKSVCSSDLNRLLLSNSPLLTSLPGHDQAAAPIGEKSTSGGPPPSFITCGESSNLEADPSLSNLSQPTHDNELATVTSDPLASLLHSSAAAAPSPLHALPGSMSSPSDHHENVSSRVGGEGKVAAHSIATTGVEAGGSPAGLTFLKDEEPAPSGGLESVESPPSKPLEFIVTHSEAVTEGVKGPEKPSIDPVCVASHIDGKETAAATTHADSTTDLRESSSTFVPLLSPPLQVSPGLTRTASPTPTATPIVTAEGSLHSTEATTTIAASTATGTSSSTITPRAVSMPICVSTPPSTNSGARATTPPASASAGSTALIGSSSSSATPLSLTPTGAAGVRPGHLKTPSRITAWIRSRVSQNKVRYRDGDFNLDLTYITPRIIAMGYPAHGTEYYIRNPIDEVERFFDERHAGHFRIYNLCSERAYDTPHRFHGCFRRFPFDDHNAPPLALILHFVLDAATFLDADAANVVAVHCKAGKGRTGIMVSCLLYYLYPDKFATANEAIHFFDQQRTCDGEGMTIPSQRRYVNYFERIVREFHGTMPAVQRRLAIKDVVIRVTREKTIVHPGDLYFIVSNQQQMLLDSRMWFPHGPTVSSAGCVFSFANLKKVPAPLVGDVKFSFFRRRPIVLSGQESTACYLWLNTTLCPTLQTVYQRSDLDKVDVAAVGKTVMVSLSFAEEPEGGETAEATAPAATAQKDEHDSE